MLRVATSQLYRQASNAIGDRQTAVSKLQQQLTTGKRLLEPADDPVGSARLMTLNSEMGRYDQYQRNIDSATGRLNAEEGALGDAGDILQRARVLTIQANNDTLNTENRGHIAAEIRQLHAQLVSLGNAQDGSGEYLFGGFQSQTAPFAPDSANPQQITYRGDGGQRLAQTGPASTLAVGDPGNEVFQVDSADPTKGLFATLDRLATTLETAPATLHADLGTALQEIDSGLDNLNGIQAKVGVRLQALENQGYTNSDFSLHLQQTISEVGDLDYAEAITQLSRETLGLQVAQQSFMRVQNLSLFNYMN